MQGPRFGRPVQLADCPDELVRRGNRRSVLSPSHHRSRTPRVEPGFPVSPRPLSCLWVVPVFAGREVLRLEPRVAQDPLTTNFKILYLSTDLSTAGANLSTDCSVIHAVIHSAAHSVRTGSALCPHSARAVPALDRHPSWTEAAGGEPRSRQWRWLQRRPNIALWARPGRSRLRQE